MRLEAVIVCVNYADFLEHTLPDNLQQLDDIVVVTDHNDQETPKLCKKYSIECIKTAAFTERGHVFNKGAAINVALSHLRKREWLIHLDADIMLCRDFRRMVDMAELDKKNIYGADRINVYGYDTWKELKPFLENHYSSKWFVDPGLCHQKEATAEAMRNVRFGARVVHVQHGWVPIGYFQMWHKEAGVGYNYKVGAASGSDVMFPAQWPREKRVLLPEVVVYHLDSEPRHRIGTNWKGRKSRPFTENGLPKETSRHLPHYDPNWPWPWWWTVGKQETWTDEPPKGMKPPKK